MVLLINSLLRHIVFSIGNIENEFSCFVTSIFEKFKLLISISFTSLNIKFGFSSRNLKNIAFLIISFKLIILLFFSSLIKYLTIIILSLLKLSFIFIIAKLSILLIISNCDISISKS